MGVEIPARRSASSAAAISARSSPTARIGLRMKVIAYDPFLSPERAMRSRRREGRARRIVQSRRFHHAAHAAHRQDQEYRRRQGDRDDEEGRAHHQLRARRPGRRSGAARGARNPATSPAPPSTCSSRSRRRRTRCSAMPNVVCTPHLGAATTRGAGERRAAGRRADVGLSAARRHLQRRQLPLDHRRGGAASSSRSSRSPKSSARSPASSPRPASARCRSPMRARWRR